VHSLSNWGQCEYVWADVIWSATCLVFDDVVSSVGSMFGMCLSSVNFVLLPSSMSYSRAPPLPPSSVSKICFPRCFPRKIYVYFLHSTSLVTT
jgi:hypothetical protein